MAQKVILLHSSGSCEFNNRQSNRSVVAMTKFRYDINALRALAVSGVVLYHYKVIFVPGGYVGVDIFFVISGYLMTNIIVGRLQKNAFSILDFYYDRARRILPGLAGLCFCLLAAGFVFLDPVTYRYVAYTSVSALLFFSNFRFSEAIGYFDPQTDTKWLLHTWSLSVEWQFYLLYPILLIGLYKFAATRRYLTPTLWGMAAASLLLCIWSTEADPASAFYLLPQRAWELLAGGIVALQFRTCERKYSAPLLAGGLLLIGVSVFVFDKNMPWPSYWALLPVVGTCLVIAANRSDAAVFKNELIQITGKWSYSIYLWHWPIAVATGYFGASYFGVTRTGPLLIIAKLLILAAVISVGGYLLFLMKKLSERKFIPSISALPRFVPIAGALASTVGFALLVTTNRGFPERREGTSKQLETYRMVVSDWDYPRTCDGTDLAGNLRPCQLGPSERNSVLVIGDSFAMQVFNRFADAAKVRSETSLTFLASSGCPPVAGVQYATDKFHCNGFFDKALHFAETGDFKRIVLISTWYGYFSPSNSTICFVAGDSCKQEPEPTRYFEQLDATLAKFAARLLEFRKRGIEIVIVSATPFGEWDVPSELLKRQFLGIDTKDIDYIDRAQFETYIAPLKERLMSLASSIGATFVDPLDFLCQDGRCGTIDENAVPYYRDREHFRAGAVRAGRFGFLDDALGAQKQYSAMPAP